MNAVVDLPEGFRLYRYESVGSTNDEAKALARTGAVDGTLVWASEQRAGRGRRGRVWHSPPGNLYLSLLLRPDTPPARAAQLSFVAALGLGDALLALTGPDLRLGYKWPNDLLAGGKKLAGILLEAECGAGGIEFVVIGAGVNIAAAPAGTEYPATSLAAEGFPGITPVLLLENFVRCFAAWRRRWRDEGFSPLRAAWLTRASGLGEPIRVRLDRATFDGIFVDLDTAGALLLEGADGRCRIAAGEVFPLHVAEEDGAWRDARRLSPASFQSC